MFKIGKLFHLTQVVEDIDVADRWYNRVFSPCRCYRGYMPEAFRVASLLAIDNFIIEPVQLARVPNIELSPLFKFKQKHGNRLHSIAWYVDNLERAFEACRDAGIRMVDVTGKPVEALDHVKAIKYFWTHPRDTHGALEFARLDPEFTIDPRVQAFWPGDFWREKHALGLAGTLGLTMVVRDLDGAANFYKSFLGGTEVSVPADDGRRAFAVGEGTIVELVAPSTKELQKFGDGLLGMTFYVGDLKRVEKFLESISLPASRAKSGDLVVSPEHALGTTLSFRQSA